MNRNNRTMKCKEIYQNVTTFFVLTLYVYYTYYLNRVG